MGIRRCSTERTAAMTEGENSMYSLIIVEDEKMERDALVRIVPWKELGFSVVKAFRDGAECIAYLEEFVPDVILTDIRMAPKGGLDISRYAAEKRLHTQIILMSAYKEFEYARQAIECGVVHYLVKPVSLPKIREVFQQVRQVLDDQLSADEREAAKMPKVKRSTDRVMSYIREHYAEDLTLRTISEQLYLNPGYISRMLKEQTGKNFTDIIAGIRIERAVWLLENTNMYVYEIAEEVGYQNLKYFYQIFKKNTGKAPNEYREEV